MRLYNLGHPRVLQYTATALPRKRGWLCRATAEFVIALPRYRVFYGTTAPLELPVLAFKCLVAWHAWPSGVCMASSAVHLPRYRAFRAHITAQLSRAVYRVPRYRGHAVALLRVTQIMVIQKSVIENPIP